MGDGIYLVKSGHMIYHMGDGIYLVKSRYMPYYMVGMSSIVDKSINQHFQFVN